jgi:hypothetical protein
MRTARHWSVRHSRGLEPSTTHSSGRSSPLDPLWRGIGYVRLERPVAAAEQRGERIPVRLPDVRAMRALLDRDVVPMNCPKELRNGPCGGVRANGHAKSTRR